MLLEFILTLVPQIIVGCAYEIKEAPNSSNFGDITIQVFLIVIVIFLIFISSKKFPKFFDTYFSNILLILSFFNLIIFSIVNQIIEVLKWFDILVYIKLNLILIDILIAPFIYFFLSFINQVFINFLILVTDLFETFFDFLIPFFLADAFLAFGLCLSGISLFLALDWYFVYLFLGFILSITFFILKIPYFWGFIDSTNLLENIDFIWDQYLNKPENYISANLHPSKGEDRLLTQGLVLSFILRAEKLKIESKRYISLTKPNLGKYSLNEPSINSWKFGILNTEYVKRMSIIVRENKGPVVGLFMMSYIPFASYLFYRGYKINYEVNARIQEANAKLGVVELDVKLKLEELALEREKLRQVKELTHQPTIDASLTENTQIKLQMCFEFGDQFELCNAFFYYF